MRNVEFALRSPGPVHQSGRRGFTLFEIMIGMVIAGVLFVLGYSKLSSISTDARRQSCLDNQLLIDRAVRNWEHRNRDFPAGAELTFDQNGKIGSSGGLGSGKKPAGTAVLDLSGGADIFICAERALVAGGRSKLTASGRAAEENYVWISSATADPRLAGKRIGAYCIHYNAIGPDGTSETRHR